MNARLFISIAVFVIVCSTVSAQGFHRGRSILDLSNDSSFNDLSILDKEVKDKRLVLIGENHYYRGDNVATELKFFKYLHQREGFNVFLLEFGYSMGWLLNQYLQSNDTSYNNFISNSFYTEYTDLFKELKNYYDSTPDKFIISGIDMERHPSFPIKVLSTLLKDIKGKPHDSIRLSIESIMALDEYYDYAHKENRRYNTYSSSYYGGWQDKISINTAKTLEELLSDYHRKAGLFAAFAGENAKLFEKIMYGLEEARWYWEHSYGSATAQSYLRREIYMEKQLHELLKSDTLKMFGQFGRCHVTTSRFSEECAYFNYNSLATKVSSLDDSVYKEKMFVIGTFYPGSYYETRNLKQSINAGLDRFIKDAEEGKSTLYLLQDSNRYDDTLRRRFNAVIINASGNVSKRKKTKGNYSSYYTEYLSLRYLQSQSSFSQLNNLMGGNIPEAQQYVGLGITSLAYHLYFSTSYNHMLPSNTRINDSLASDLRGSKFLMSLGYCTNEDYKLVFAAGLGFGYDRKIINVQREYQEAIFNNISLQSKEIELQRNAFIGGLDLNLFYRTGDLFFGLYACQQADLSTKKWRVNGNKNGSVPTKANNDLFFGVAFGLGL